MKRLIIWIIAILLVMPFTSAYAFNNTFDSNDIVNVNVYCMLLNNSKCDYNSTTCEITAFYPNTSFLVQQEYMSSNVSGFFNYSFGILDVEGTYSALTYCNNSEEGAVSFEFTVGDPDDTYDETFWLYVFLLIIPLFICIVGWLTEDKYFYMIAGMLLCATAFYFRSNGFPKLDNPFIEEIAIVIVAGIGLYLTVKNGYDLAMEGMGK